MSVIVQAAPNCLAVDTSGKLTLARVQAVMAAPVSVGGKPARYVRGFARYVSLHEPESLADIAGDELQMVTGEGAGIWLVQHVRNPGWVASAQLGADLGGAARENALQAGYLPNASLFFDAEGVANPGPAMVACLQAWAAEIAKTFGPGEYTGYDNGETPDQHYHAQPNVHIYWKAPGPWAVAVRGYAITQGEQMVIGGETVDPDELSADLLGGRLQWMIDPDKALARFPSDLVPTPPPSFPVLA